MKILKQEKTGSKIKFEVEASFDSYKEAREEVIKSFSKDINVPGFRPGKAPKNLVENNLNPAAVIDRSIQHLIANLYPKLMHEAKIDPIDYPNVDIKTFEEGKPLVFTIEVEVYPDVELGKYKGIKLKKKSTEVTDDQVQLVMGDLQNRFSKNVEQPEGTVQKGDILDLEVQAEAEGAEIKRWPRKLEHFPIGNAYISPDFDYQVEGLKVNDEKTFEILFPADYNIPEIAGKTVTFKVKVLKINRKELQPLDDEFAKAVSSFGNLEELKEEIKKNLITEKTEESDADLKNQLVDLATKEAKIELPKALIDMETDIMVEELKANLSRSNLTLENYLKAVKKNGQEIRDELSIPATARAKGKVVLKKVAEVENITVQPHDIDTELALMASESGQSTDEYKKAMGEGGIAYVKDFLLRKKALDFLVSQAKIEEIQ